MTSHHVIYNMTVVTCLFYCQRKEKEILNQEKEKKNVSVQVYYNNQ